MLRSNWSMVKSTCCSCQGPVWFPSIQTKYLKVPCNFSSKDPSPFLGFVGTNLHIVNIHTKKKKFKYPNKLPDLTTIHLP